MLSGLPLGLALLCLTGPWYDWPNPQHYGRSLTLLLIFSLVPLIETGHTLSPIALAWSHRGFRRLMLERKGKFILLPAAVLLTASAIGAATSLGLTSYVNGPHRMFDAPLVAMIVAPGQWFRWGHAEFVSFAFHAALTNPFPILVWVYMVWNAYHFGMQNFGVLQIYSKRQADVSKGSQRRPGNQRRVDKTFCLTVTVAAMVTAFPVGWLQSVGARDLCITLSLVATGGMLWRELRIGFCPPRSAFILADGLALALIWWQPIVGVAVYSLNHWLVAIGLSAHAFGASRSNHSRHWLFVGAMLTFGAVGFVWLLPTANGTMLRVIPCVLTERLGFGLVHFLYDRWIWQRTAPTMRDLVAA